jgi:hypothetical protein
MNANERGNRTKIQPQMNADGRRFLPPESTYIRGNNSLFLEGVPFARSMTTSSKRNLFTPLQQRLRRDKFSVIRGLFSLFESVFYLRLSAFIGGLAFFWVLQLPALGAEPVIRANLSVATTTVDQPVELQIEIQNARIIDPPDVAADHLQIDMAGQSTRYQVINGQPSFSSIFSYLVTPSLDGTFSIPPVPITIDGKTYYTNELTLQVTKKAPNNPATAPDKPYFGELVIPKDSAFVGEPVPVELRFYFDRRIWYQPYPQGQFPIIDGDGFVTKKYPDPVEKEETVNGKRYRLLIYRTAITGVHAGRLELPSA